MGCRTSRHKILVVVTEELKELIMRILSRVTFWGLLLLSPALALAHPAGAALNGWHDGFAHPLHGWDHLLAMIAVGVWAAQQRGRLVWIIPLTFVSIMTLGGIAGVAGVKLPGVDLVIVLSVVVLGALVVRRTILPSRVALVLVGVFAFFHGFAHGSEMMWPRFGGLLTVWI